jgi:hypothetical protein
LLKAPMRKDFGYRLHPKHILGRIRFIRRVKELGFALKEIKESTPFPVLALTLNHDVQANGRFCGVRNIAKPLDRTVPSIMLIFTCSL